MAAASSSTDEKLRCDPHEIIYGTQLDSAPYWDTDDDGDDCGPGPHDLYQRFTWTIDNFSNINDTMLSSDLFDVGGYKWNILIYPQGVDNASIYLSLFLRVDNHEELLPGWSHYAQFTLCLVNKDAMKSKYSDTLHRFWNKEYDWGWKRYIELSRLPDGFLTNDVLTIIAQVQVIRERLDQPFRCLDEPYRREISKVYMTNVESIIRRFADERMKKISKSINDEGTWSRLSAFWLRTDESARQHITREKTGTILRHLVEHFFVTREVSSTLLMDSLYAGLKVIKQRGMKNREETVADHAQRQVLEDDGRSTPMVLVDKDNDMFVLADDAILLLERVALLQIDDAILLLERVALLHIGPHPPSRNGISLDNYLSKSKDGSTSDQESTEHYDARLVKLGWKALDFFFLSHVFSRIEAAYQEATALKHQEKHMEDMVEENRKRIGDQQL